MDERTIADILYDAQSYANIARDKWREGDVNATLYWIEQARQEAKRAMQTILETQEAA